MAPVGQKPSQWLCLMKPLREMCSQTIVSKALSWDIIGKSAPMLAEITIRKSQAGVLFVLFVCSIAVGPRILTSEWHNNLTSLNSRHGFSNSPYAMSSV
jgi:hypothetical protein